jgi:S1-C subfamily serine protease
MIAAITSEAWCQDMPPQVIDRAKHATVMVVTFASQKEKADTPLGSGTGYFVNASGLLITNNHVVDLAHGKTLRERQKIQFAANLLSYKIITDIPHYPKANSSSWIRMPAGCSLRT